MASDEKGGVPVNGGLDRLSATSDGSCKSSKLDEEFLDRWGFRLSPLYQLALRFYKEKEGKALNLCYQERLSLVAFAKQISCGKFDLSLYPSVGVLDVIGRDRREAWKSLGEMSCDDAMASFIDLLDHKCTSFRPFIEAHRADLENNRRARMEEDMARRAEEERSRLEEEDKGRREEERQRQEVYKTQIQEALNQQTLAQFRAYTQQQYPTDPNKQVELLRELQEQHYERYMEQIMRMVREEGIVAQEEQTPFPPVPPLQDFPAEFPESEDEEGSHGIMTEASMWTRKDVKEFKESIRKEGGDSILRVGHGETITVRVPTNDEGTCLFWEFATDYYDIGFGVYFEWTKSSTNQVSVHVSESEDEDDYLNEDDDSDNSDHLDGDVEGGLKLASSRAPLSIIIPVCKRKCQDEVYAGSHAYPGHGVYLLKFDNSYSVLRSKTLYYRVYYTR